MVDFVIIIRRLCFCLCDLGLGLVEGKFSGVHGVQFDGTMVPLAVIVCGIFYASFFFFKFGLFVWTLMMNVLIGWLSVNFLDGVSPMLVFSVVVMIDVSKVVFLVWDFCFGTFTSGVVCKELFLFNCW